MNSHRISPVLAILFLSAPLLMAQGTQDDYDRAANLRTRTRDKVFRTRVEPQWIEGSSNFWYRVRTGVESHEYVFVDVTNKTRKPAFDAKKLTESIKKTIGVGALPNNLNLRDFEIDAEQKYLSFVIDGKRWTCDLSNDELSSEQLDKPDSKEYSDSLRSLASVPRSTNRGEDTYVNFINKLDETIELYWRAGDGSQRLYAEIEPGKEHDQHTFGGHIWLAKTKDGEVVAIFRAENEHRAAVIDGSVEIKESRKKKPRDKPERDKGRNPATSSPDGSWLAFIKDHNLFLRSAEQSDLESESSAVQLSHDGTAEDPYQGRIRWSPDSRKLLAIQKSVGQKREVFMIESSPKDQLQPKLHTMVYDKPGDNLPIAKPRLFDVALHKQIDVKTELFPNAWSISDLRWNSDSSNFTFLYNQRGHQVLRIVRVDAESGEVTAVVDEVSKTFVDYAGKRFSRYLGDTEELIWMSERDGWNHLYLYDFRTGNVKNQITNGEWVVRGVERVDEEARRVYFRACGVFPEQDPYYIHYGFVDFDGSNLTWLTKGDGTHEIEYTPDNKHFIDRYSRVDQPPITELRRSKDGALVCELERGDWSQLLETDWQAPERFVAKGRDGETDIYGVIYRPTNFDVTKKYPVIEKIYAGPHSSFVPKSFAPYRRDQSYAELGFIVVQIDGMGTSNRSKAFHDVCWKNLGDSGFPDRILWIKAAAKKYPQLDISRVGIFGGSAGGQSTLRALLAHGDFYGVGVADCGCHDNRMDKVWWNELWMSWPVGPHYEEQSNVTQAHRLTGKLLLTVGELDRNVDPASTMQVVDALIKADKDFDFLIVPGAGHGVGESPYANRRRQDFFVRHLLGVEPRK